MDRVERLVRQAYVAREGTGARQYGQDIIWYLWCGALSPLFGKSKMATFERYFIDDPTTHGEARNAYYTYHDRVETADAILAAFGLNPAHAHIINGHVPVKVRKGEKPVKADGKLIVIDGGFARAYQAQTGIAGYTLVYNSYGLLLTSHESFESVEQIVSTGKDLPSEAEVLEANYDRIRVRDTDLGQRIQQQIADLRALLAAYRAGLIKES